jgi:hypothetical protein
MEARSTTVGHGAADGRPPWAAGNLLRMFRLRLSRLAAITGAAALTVAAAIALLTSGGRPAGSPRPATAQAPISASQPDSSQEIVVFIVASQEQAAQVRGTVFELSRVMDTEPLPPVQAEFVVAGIDQAASTLEAYREVNQIRAAQGETPIPIVDLTH